MRAINQTTAAVRKACQPRHARRGGPLALGAIAFGLVLTAAACGDDSAGLASNDADALAYSDTDPQIQIVSPADGATVSGTVRFEVETTNLDLAPAGSTSDSEGHWHLLIDRDCIEPGEEIPKTENSVHVGSGDPFLEVELTPGVHELCAQIGDGLHIARSITHTITVEVEEP